MTNRRRDDDETMKPSTIVYIGCYTKPHQADPFEDELGGVEHDDSKVGSGILAVSMSVEGKLSYLNDGNPVVPSALVSNPSYLAIVKGSKEEPDRLCTVSEGDEGKLFVFTIDQKTNTLQPMGGEGLSTHGSFPCHIMTQHVVEVSGNNPLVERVFVSNYGSNEGIVSMYHLGGTQVTHQATVALGRSGSNVSSSRQSSTHAHCCARYEGLSNTFFTADLGSDAVIEYEFGSDKITEVRRLALPPGSGPRSIEFHQVASDVEFGIVSLEMTAQIQLIRRRRHDDCLEAWGSPVSILPPNWPEEGNDIARFNNGRWASDVVWSKNGRFVFAAARLHNSISIFRLKHPGKQYPKDFDDLSLEWVDRIPTGGKTPRCLTVSPCGEFLLVAHQHSHDVSSFRIDGDSGHLTFVDKIEAPLAACVKMQPRPTC